MDNQVINTEIISSLVLNGDIAKLNSAQRVQYYTSLCKNLGIDPLTQPFSIITLQGKQTLYANKNCTQQLAKVYKIGLEILKNERIEDVYIVTVRATDGQRFTDEIGAVTIGSMKGDGLANALMKASTKAKRRAVLAFCGLGILDESELDTVKVTNKQDIEIRPEAMLHDTIQEIVPPEPMSQELQQLVDLAKQAFAGPLNFARWLGTNFQKNDPNELTPEQIKRAVNLLMDLIIQKKEGKENEAI